MLSEEPMRSRGNILIFRPTMAASINFEEIAKLITKLWILKILLIRSIHETFLYNFYFIINQYFHIKLK